MPTNRRRVRRPSQAQPWQTEMMLTGWCTSKTGEKIRRMGLTIWDPPLPAWTEVEAELLPDWLKEHPASRPWGWWKDNATGPRRRTGGSGRRERNASLEFGVPTDTWFKDVDPARPPLYESQAAYLARHNLLTPAENKWLADHPEALKPEAIEYRLSTGPDVYYVGYSGPGYYEDTEDI